MGRGLLHQCRITPGFQCLAVADLQVERTLRCLADMGVPARLAESESAIQEALQDGCVAVMADGHLLARIPQLEAVVEATSAIRAGGAFAMAALEHGKHLILMNAEVDLIFGPALLDAARRRGLVCTSCDGDQHGVITRLMDDLELWGFAPVMAGNIKGFLDRYANPTTIIPEADRRNLDYGMCTAYTDGTKLNIEMALVANARGYRTQTPGMVGPRAREVHEVTSLFDLEGLRTKGTPAVDYILGAEPGGGVFAIGYNDHPYQRDMMAYYKMGPGPYYVFYRPYHLCHVEALRGIAEAVLDQSALLAPEHGWRTTVTAYAKKDLRAGERLDGVGGYACYGLIENTGPDGSPEGLPICLAENLVLLHSLHRDQRITLEDVMLPEDRSDVRLYRQSREVAAQGVP